MINFSKKASLKFQIGCLSILFILSAAYTTFSFVSALNQQRLDGQIINIAGRQRMLAQKFAKEIFLQWQSESSNLANKTAELFTVSLAALKNGGQTFSDLQMTKPIEIPATQIPEVSISLQEVEKQWQSVYKELIASTKALAKPEGEALKSINKRVDKLVGTMNKTVGLMAKESSTKTDALSSQTTLLLAFTLIIGGFFSVIIIKVITNPISALMISAKRIRNGNL